MSTTAQRFVAIMEALSNVSQVGSTANEIVQRANLTSSTGYRMLAELEELGLVHRIGDRKLVANFNFERQVRHPGLDPKELAYLCKKISLELTSSSEIVVQSGQNLFWHIVQQHEDQAIRPRAYPGFTRGSYELDSLSRMALAHCNLAKIRREWDTSCFFSTGMSPRELDWAEAKRMITDVDPLGVEFDLLGNAQGIRRFCAAVHAPSGELACLLTVAEAATPLRDQNAHVAKITNLLVAAKAQVEQGSLPRRPVLPCR